MAVPISGGGEVGQVEEGGEGERECFWPTTGADIVEADRVRACYFQMIFPITILAVSRLLN